MDNTNHHNENKIISPNKLLEDINPESEYHGGSEIFVHFSEIKCDSQFKKLIHKR